MTNHPNRRPLPYRLRYGQHEAAFTDGTYARELARSISEDQRCVVEIEKTHGPDRGVLGRFQNGVPVAITS